jgi:hypothetical protein
MYKRTKGILQAGHFRLSRPEFLPQLEHFMHSPKRWFLIPKASIAKMKGESATTLAQGSSVQD